MKGELLGLGRRGVRGIGFRGRRRGSGRLRLRVEVAVGLGLVVVVRGREMLEGRFDPDVMVEEEEDVLDFERVVGREGWGERDGRRLRGRGRVGRRRGVSDDGKGGDDLR